MVKSSKESLGRNQSTGHGELRTIDGTAIFGRKPTLFSRQAQTHGRSSSASTRANAIDLEADEDEDRLPPAFALASLHTTLGAAAAADGHLKSYATVRRPRPAQRVAPCETSDPPCSVSCTRVRCGEPVLCELCAPRGARVSRAHTGVASHSPSPARGWARSPR